MKMRPSSDKSDQQPLFTTCCSFFYCDDSLWNPMKNIKSYCQNTYITVITEGKEILTLCDSFPPRVWKADYAHQTLELV